MKHTSKLPNVGTTIFSIMSKLAHEEGALNLAQGFPGFGSDPKLHNLVSQAMAKGYNQYAPMPGIFRLREKITEKTNSLYGSEYAPGSDITITAGATQAIFTIVSTFIRPGDEVIVLKPAYDCYEPAVIVNGGKVVPIQLKAPSYKVDWSEVAHAITPKTKMFIINTPHNPTGTILEKSDMIALERILKNTDIILLSDEVYEHMVFDGKQHESVARYPGLRERSFITASFGKTFHTTGWKLGYTLAPKELMQEFQKVHQFNVFSVHHPSQHALSQYLENEKKYMQLSKFFEQKRDVFLEAIKGSRFTYTPSAGTYFQMLGYSAITDESDVNFAKKLTKQYKIAAIPTSVFNLHQEDYKMLRFCYAKDDDVLKRAGEILCAV
ncbi:methionine aminotransferase [Dokdonia sp. Hel_I_53]|uniref:methionine aminotransferase n=1 Tax=Dokdonia sp. Hel_I_53 TaxID=1566287 RepID=UPI00119C3D8B|nr:methionine aminotransferase [Dokdonia sp. Hel_I_53]TVZ52467.1 methionine aminotransferase [Dokdonia sp. Hel_I_53]